jgi:peroxiredoxin
VERRVVAALALGFVAATASVVGVLAWAGREPAVDGTFRLDEPGVFSEPIATNDVAGALLPDVELVDADGATRRLAEFRGRPLVVNVWFSSCVPCATELADFASVHAELGDAVQFVGVDPLDSVDDMVAFAEARGVQYPLLRDPDRTFVGAVPVIVYPTTMFVDAAGRVVRQTAATDAEHLRANLAELFPDVVPAVVPDAVPDP